MVELTNLSYIHCTRTYIRGYAVAQLVEALRYKPEGGGGSIPDGVTEIFQ